MSLSEKLNLAIEKSLTGLAAKSVETDKKLKADVLTKLTGKTV